MLSKEEHSLHQKESLVTVDVKKISNLSLTLNKTEQDLTQLKAKLVKEESELKD